MSDADIDNPDSNVESSHAPAAHARWRWVGLFGLVVCVALCIWSWQPGGLLADLTRLDQDAEWKIARLKQFFDNCGNFAPLAYFVFVTVEVVVAPIPGVMLYAPGGVIFGGFLGGAIALAGNVVGAGIACQAIRSLGGDRLSQFVSSESLQNVQTAIAERGGWLIFLLRVNPLTSSDLVSYASGLTRIPVWKVMLATAFGMAPLCFAQAYLAENLFTHIPELIYPLVGLTVVYIVVVIVIIRRLISRTPEG